MTQNTSDIVCGKPPRESRTEQVQILSQGSLNGYKRLFGGKLMEWIDVVAAIPEKTLRPQPSIHWSSGPPPTPTTQLCLWEM